MIGAGLVRTTKERFGVLAVSPPLSTFTTKVKFPKFVGVPLSTPVVGSSDMPGGSDPDATDHMKGAVPPAT
jgi:hypothetical protein